MFKEDLKSTQIMKTMNTNMRKMARKEGEGGSDKHQLVRIIWWCEIIHIVQNSINSLNLKLRIIQLFSP